MSVLLQQIEKARQRARDIDLRSLADVDRATPPIDMAPPDAIDQRRQVLARTYGDNDYSQLLFERIIAGNELQPINYLSHGVVTARPICRLTINDDVGRLQGYATGFLVAPGVLLTNHHVFPTAGAAVHSIAEFEFELDVFDQAKAPVSFGLAPDKLFLTSSDLDYSVVAVAQRNAAGKLLSDYGYLPLIESPGKVVEGEWMTIIQHPNGQRKQVCVRENKLLKRTGDVLWYSTDTLPGTSGSPVFNNDWQVVALHHQGVPEMKNGVPQTVDGRDFIDGQDDETSIKWIANEGIRVSRLVGDLRRAAPSEPLLQPLFSMSPERARALMASFVETALKDLSSRHLLASSRFPPPSEKRIKPMPTRSVDLTLDIADDGLVSVRQAGAGRSSSSSEAARSTAAASSSPRPPQYDVPFDRDYSPKGKRKGFQSNYLGDGIDIPLPDLGSLRSEVTKMIEPVGGNDHVLHYRGYSVVMHATRKFAILTAANIDGGGRFQLRRPHDEWRFDPRIPQSAQVGGYYYASNQFDRGHLTRYEDMEYGGSPTDAIASAADTLHFTNCSPQHAKFNQSKQLWQGLEQAVLEQAIEARSFRAIVMTGPVLDPGDPVWERFKDIQYPLRYWKIAVALTSNNKAFAAGFVLDQSEVIAQFGIEAVEIPPFALFKTYQVPIAEIERLTGLSFKMNGGGPLSAADPLTDAATRRMASSRARMSVTEASSAGAIPASYVPLGDTSDVILPRL